MSDTLTPSRGGWGGSQQSDWAFGPLRADFSVHFWCTHTVVKQRKRLFSTRSKNQGVIIATEEVRFINTRPLTSPSPPNLICWRKAFPTQTRSRRGAESICNLSRSNEASAASQCLLNCACTPRLGLVFVNAPRPY